MAGEYVSVYVTMPTEQDARDMALAMVKEGLAACANMLQAKSVYQYEGALVEEPEVVMFLKTTRAQLDRLVAAIAKRHRYEIPCIVAFDIEAGYQPYLDWLRASTARPGG